MTARFAAVASLAFLLTLSTAQAQTFKKGFIYQPSSGVFWDPSVIYHAGTTCSRCMVATAFGRRLPKKASTGRITALC